ncbi:Malate-2H(+)/Na(+)-lactate antiporter [Lactobacillus helveticus]|nr:Malate-2H(+)/Na(+)-lactate antiporter [Lactobacillus helveticus]
MDPTKIERTSHVLQTNFSISWWAVVPIVFMLLCAWRKVPAIPTLFINIAATVIMIFVQNPHESVQSLNNLIMNGFVAKTSDASVNALLTRGGISSMMATVALIISTLSLINFGTDYARIPRILMRGGIALSVLFLSIYNSLFRL